MLILLCILIYLVGDWRSVSRATFCKRAEFAAKFSSWPPNGPTGTESPHQLKNVLKKVNLSLPLLAERLVQERYLS